MIYPLARTLLFQLDPERAHSVALGTARGCLPPALARMLASRAVQAPRRLFGIEFPNPVGLAAGLDKNGDYLWPLHALGFGFIELGTVTPRAQPGNERPRLFRLPEQRALINRLGFNNLGVDHLVARVRAFRERMPDAVLGINIGKNRDTPLAAAAEDYLTGLRKVYDIASYVTVNISSPNTPGLRELQHGESLDTLLQALQAERARLEDSSGTRRPLLVKLSPDLQSAELPAIAAALQRSGVDGAIVSNTTNSRPGVESHRLAQEAGGLSGAPLEALSLGVLAGLHRELGDQLPLIGVGGIMDADSAARRIAAGAELVQLYTGLIYKGPALVGEVARRLASV